MRALSVLDRLPHTIDDKEVLTKIYGNKLERFLRLIRKHEGGLNPEGLLLLLRVAFASVAVLCDLGQKNTVRGLLAQDREERRCAD